MNRAHTLDIIRSKIVKEGALSQLLSIWSFQEQQIVFTNGCFDLLHQGHVDYLAKAADLGDKLIIGLNSDSSTKALKGEGRPINDQDSRALLLAAMSFVSAVVIFDESTPIKLIELIKPDILVKGADYTIDKIVGAEFVLSNGGSVETIEYIPGYSTTLIESRIKSRV